MFRRRRESFTDSPPLTLPSYRTNCEKDSVVLREKTLCNSVVKINLVAYRSKEIPSVYPLSPVTPAVHEIKIHSLKIRIHLNKSATMKIFFVCLLLYCTLFARSQSGSGTYTSNGYENCTWHEESNTIDDCKINWADAEIEIDEVESSIDISTTSDVSYTIISKRTSVVSEEETNIYYLVKDESGNYLQCRLNEFRTLKTLYIVSCDEDENPIFYNNEASVTGWVLME